MFNTPWHIRGFAFLFMLFNLMSSILNHSEFIFISIHEFFSFGFTPLLMRLHGQKH